MFLCRSGRLSAAAVDRALRSTGSFLLRVRADGPADVGSTLRRGHALHRCPCVSGAAAAHLRRRRPVRGWDPSAGGGEPDVGRRLLSAAAAAAAPVRPAGGPLAGDRGVSRPRWSAGTGQTRSSSTAASAKKSDAGEERTDSGGDNNNNNNNNKAKEQNLKEASTTSSSTAKVLGEAEPEGEKPNKTQQLKKVFKEYGAVGVSFHICISLMSLGMFYLLISSGIDMTAMLCKLGFSEAVVRSRMAAGTSTFVLAYAIHKLFAPVRISITLVSVPLIVRYFRKTGLFKPPTPAP